MWRGNSSFVIFARAYSSSPSQISRLSLFSGASSAVTFCTAAKRERPRAAAAHAFDQVQQDPFAVCLPTLERHVRLRHCPFEDGTVVHQSPLAAGRSEPS